MWRSLLSQAKIQALQTDLASKNETIEQQAKLIEEQGRAIQAFMEAESATQFINATERNMQQKAETSMELRDLKERIGGLSSMTDSGDLHFQVGSSSLTPISSS